jgi:O-antigen ligase
MALTESIAWIRFPLLAMASVFWLARHAALLKLMLLMTGLGLILMCFILTAELYVNFSEWSSLGGMSARLSWPYGDFVSGNYLGKFGLIMAVWASANVSAPSADRIIAGASLGLLLLIFTILTGERINAILVFSTLFFAMLWLNYRRMKFLFVGGSCLVGGAILAISTTEFLTMKFTSSLVEGIFDIQNSGYIKLWMTGLEMFKASPITGVGTGMFRYLCTEMPFADTSFIRCDNHPHQYYVQILAETGVIGFGAFVLMVGSIIYATWDEGRLSSNSLSKVCFVVPLALMFPLQSTADIFGQWVNLMMWYSIALAMAVPKSTVAKSS